MIGDSVGRFRVVSQLGQGGMGIVYRAHDERLGRDVALKFLPAHLSMDDDAKERFVHEARSASALDHPNLCTVYDIDETDDGRLFIAMALYDGETLTARLRRGPVDVDEAIDLLIQLADGLEAAHDAGILHRDVKPANVMVTRDGLAKLLDFGLAKAADVDLTEPGAILGTLAYMSPEQALGQEVDARTDVWALGVVAYELLAHRTPFQGERLSVLRSIVDDEPPPLAERAGFDPALAAIVHAALVKDPAQRTPSAAAFGDALRAWRAPPDAPAPRRKVPALLAVALVTVVAIVAWQWRVGAETERVRREVLPEIERILGGTSGWAEGSGTWRAFALALEAEQIVPDDPLLERLWPVVAHTLDLRSEPPGARVLARPYGDVDGPWQDFGTTPLEGLRLPKGFARLQLELAGHEPVESLYWSHRLSGDELTVALHTPDEVPDGMLWVAASDYTLALPGLEGLDADPVAAFWIDATEVANEDYARFVADGGYRRPELWEHAFVLDGRTLAFEEALEHLRDRTGRPGPATWEVGRYPDGEARLPVRGVSWYEAAAYARWAGKQLPTIFHWNAVAFTWAAPEILPLANFSSDGPVPVDTAAALHFAGALNLAGNVREWCRNETSRTTQRFILGGGWSDPPYAFNDAYAQRAFDRTETNGFRCMREAAASGASERLERVIELPFRDFFAEQPVSDERFEAILGQYAYDRGPLDAVVEEVLEEADWIRQRIAYDAGYGERMFGYLFLPRGGVPPFQTLVYFPGSGVIFQRSSAQLRTSSVDFFVKSGRALLWPIYTGTFERGGELTTDQPSETAAYRDYVLKWAKELRRSVDYLETRDDVDATRLAFWGTSWGGRMGPIMLAIEERFRAALLYVAGLKFQRALPAADPFHFVSRVKTPVLMLNGEFDFFFPKETSQRPLFELLGTPPEHKRWEVYPGGHSVPRNTLIEQALSWLDEYLGPVDGP